MSLETLEIRRLRSATVDSNHVLQVQGTEAADTITIAASGAQVQVVINGGAAQSFEPGTLTGYNIHGLGGNDLIVVQTALTNATIFGDGGNDRVGGGEGNETLYGNAGKDALDGGGGNDLVKGNGGNDKLFGNNGGDRLYGGAGNDYLDGGSSNDKLYPETGNDTALGQSGNDNFFAHDGEADSLFGGTGTDTGIVDGQDSRGSIEQIAII